MRNLIICLPAMIWPRILVFTSMMLRVLTPAAFGSYGAGIYIPKLGLVPIILLLVFQVICELINTRVVTVAFFTPFSSGPEDK